MTVAGSFVTVFEGDDGCPQPTAVCANGAVGGEFRCQLRTSTDRHREWDAAAVAHRRVKLSGGREAVFAHPHPAPTTRGAPGRKDGVKHSGSQACDPRHGRKASQGILEKWLFLRRPMFNSTTIGGCCRPRSCCTAPIRPRASSRSNERESMLSPCILVAKTESSPPPETDFGPGWLQTGQSPGPLCDALPRSTRLPAITRFGT